MEDKQKKEMLKKQLDKINNHFISNDIMTKEQYTELSKDFLLKAISQLLTNK